MPATTTNKTEDRTFNILARKVPPEIWARTRQNAKFSKLRFNDYLIRLFAHSQPFPPADSPTTPSPDNPSPNHTTNEPAVPSTRTP